MKQFIGNYILNSNSIIKEIIMLDSKDNNFAYCICYNENTYNYFIERIEIISY